LALYGKLKELFMGSKKVLLIVVVSLLLIGGLGALAKYFIFNDPDMPQMPARQETPAIPAKPLIPVVVQPSAPLVQQQQQPVPAAAAPMVDVTSGASRRLTELRAALEVRQAELDLMEVEKKMSNLNPPVAPVIIAAPSAPEQQQIKRQGATPRVVSISDMDADLSAVNR
jgi:hypothetical protein